MAEFWNPTPFTGAREEILAARGSGPPTLPNRADLPGALRGLISDLLAYEREQRPPTAAEVVGRLDALRAARADLDRLLSGDVEGDVFKATLAAFLKVDSGTLIKSSSGNTQFRSAFTKVSSETDLPPDYRLLAQAIMALAETDYRRAAIDAGTATEVAFAAAISDELQAKESAPEFIDQTIRRANGLDGLIALYCSFGRDLPVSLGNVRANLAGVRNDAAHAGRVPSTEEATRAVELAHVLVSAAHPYDGSAQPPVAH